MKKLLIFLGGVVLVLIAILLFNTLTFKSKQINYDPVSLVDIPESSVANFAGSIKFPTVSYQNSEDFRAEPFLEFHAYLAATYPLVDSFLTLEKIGELTLLYKWQGTNATLDPVILMSHQDVVPVDGPTKNDWDHDPFSGDIDGEFVWGRGSLDDKISLIAIMEATEMLLAKGFAPERTIYLAFGHDEEIGGEEGARLIAEKLKAQGVRADFVLDEGGYLVDGMIPGFDKTAAIINIAEKGYVSFELTIRTDGGHSSAPPRDNAIGMLSKAIVDLENNQFDYRMVAPIKATLDHLGPEFPFTQKLVFANPWLFSSLVLEGFSGKTTTAPTIINSGVKDNVMPTEAKAAVNFRILQGETIEDVKQHVIEVVDNENIEIAQLGNARNPSAVSSIESSGYATLDKTIRQVFPDAITSPGLVGGGTDAKFFYSISDNVYRFVPMRLSPNIVSGFHGLNEKIGVDNYKECIQFYHQLIQNSASTPK